MTDRNIRFSELCKILESFGLVISRGKGSEAKISDPYRTKKITVIKKHGANPQIHRQVVAAVRRKFQLTARDGVADGDFYGRA